MPPDSTYLLDNTRPEGAERMDVLARLYDAPSRRALAATGLAPGWRCLEVGGGGGSIARWLAAQVGEAGSVWCTDIEPRLLSPLPNLRIERHDIRHDPLPDAHFDLIHARLVLIHIAERDTVFGRLLAALRPGGWLVIEDFDALSLVADPANFPHEMAVPTSDAVRSWLVAGGSDPTFGRSLYGRFKALGLEDVAAEGRMVMFDRDNGGADLMRVNFEQVGAELVKAGLVSAAQLAADLARVASPQYASPSPVMWTVSGRKAAD